MLDSGRIKLSQANSCGGNVVVRFGVPGQVFGQGALVRKFTYISSALAVGTSRTLSWSSESIWQLMRTYPRLAENVFGMMVIQLFQSRDQCLYLATEAVERRLARSLAQLAYSLGKKSGRGIIIGDGFSAKDLADLSGTTIYTVSRVLGEWERRGMVKKGRGWVIVLEIDALLEVGTSVKSEPVGELEPADSLTLDAPVPVA